MAYYNKMRKNNLPEYWDNTEKYMDMNTFLQMYSINNDALKHFK